MSAHSELSLERRKASLTTDPDQEPNKLEAAAYAPEWDSYVSMWERAGFESAHSGMMS